MTMRNERGIIADWLVKIVLGLAIFGVIGYDAGSIIVNHFTLDDGADQVAIAVSLTVGSRSQARNFTDEEIYRLAESEVESEGSAVPGARVHREGTNVDETGIVRIRLRRVADTLIVSRIGAIKNWARATAVGQAGTT